MIVKLSVPNDHSGHRTPRGIQVYMASASLWQLDGNHLVLKCFDVKRSQFAGSPIMYYRVNRGNHDRVIFLLCSIWSINHIPGQVDFNAKCAHSLWTSCCKRYLFPQMLYIIEQVCCLFQNHLWEVGPVELLKRFCSRGSLCVNYQSLVQTMDKSHLTFIFLQVLHLAGRSLKPQTAFTARKIIIHYPTL